MDRNWRVLNPTWCNDHAKIANRGNWRATLRLRERASNKQRYSLETVALQRDSNKTDASVKAQAYICFDRGARSSCLQDPACPTGNGSSCFASIAVSPDRCYYMLFETCARGQAD